MAYSYIRYTGNGTQTDFSFAFPYFSTSNISVTVNGTAAPFTWVNSSTVKITTAPASGAVIFIQRTTPKDITPVNFVDGSVLLEADLDTLALFSLYAAQESIDEANKAIKLNSSGNWEAQGNRINNVADPVSDQDVATKKWSETGMTAQLAIATNQASAANGSATAAASSAAASSASATNSAASASTATTKAAEASSSATAAATSATSAATSATTATTKAAEGVTSASTASTKASEASSSATTASTAAGSANTSATAAAGSATAASNSASGAAASATTATTKASEASSSATSAASSATTATGAASTATTKATEASTSATNAASSATASASSASSASTSATTATTQATNAASSASAANTSAVSAASSAASAAALLDNFDDRYLGAKSSAPSLDNDGNALLLGALYFDSTTGKMRVYTASGWIDASSASVATLATFEFVATSGQTVFTGNDANGASLSYVAPALMVTLNGVRLRPGDDYTATNGTSITLVNAAALNDELVVDAFGSFLVANTYTIAETNAGFVAKDGSGNSFVTGNLGIGTNSPTAKLDIVSPVALTASLNSNTNNPYIRFQHSGASKFYIGEGSSVGGASGFYDFYGTAGVGQRFFTSDAERLRIASSGTVELLSGQLKFPSSQNATTDANTLDDYEEGTFTPVLSRDVTAPSITYGSRSGKYTKIGNLVTVQIAIHNISVSSAGAGSNILTGLPFAAVSPNNYYGSCSIGFNDAFVNVVYAGLINGSGDTQIYFRGGTGRSQSYDSGGWNNGGYLGLTFTYTT